MENSATMPVVCSSPFVRRQSELDRLCRGESGSKTGKHTETSQFFQGMHHKKMDLLNTRSTSGIKSQRQWQNFQDAHLLFLEETSMGTPCRTTRRLVGTTRARVSRTTARTSAKCAKRRSSGARRPGMRGRCLQTLAGKETRGEDTKGNKSRPDHILLSIDLASPPVTVDFLSS